MTNQKVKVVTPEQLLGERPEKVMWHHGTCDACGERLILVCHFGYDTQPDRDYRICRHCLNKYFVEMTEWTRLRWWIAKKRYEMEEKRWH